MKKSLLILVTLFSLATNAQFNVIFNIGPQTGINLVGTPVTDGTYLYGMANIGGFHDYGFVFKVKPNGTGYDTIHSFKGYPSDGTYPFGSLYFDGTFLYGMTGGGGLNNDGSIFKVKPDGSGYSKLLDFAGGSNGFNPHGAFISDGTYLYGMTDEGGINNYGLVFKIKKDGTGYTKLHSFTSNPDGANPYGSLYYDGTFLYGMTKSGGVYGEGTIFKVTPTGTGYTKIHNFGSVTGGNQPQGSLISDGTFLYGMTTNGGIGGCACNGTIFKIKPDSTAYDTIHNFNNSEGSSPMGSLILDGTTLYGVTDVGGPNSYGTIFKMMTNGTGYSILQNFAGTNGSNPQGDLLNTGGCLYGMTNSGGGSNAGVIFNFCISGLGIEKVTSGNEQVSIYPNPSSGRFNIETGLTDQQIVKVYDVNGKIVFSQAIYGTITLDANELNEGVYYLSITSIEGMVNKKIVIVK